MELSIIVPVFNSEMYLKRTVEMLQTQQLRDYEILLVDDGSTDKSAGLCDLLSEQYSNIHTFHIKNSGPGHARNYGISQAKGDYIAFCDADDQPAPNMYGRMVSIMKATGVDYVMCDIFSERDSRAFGFPWLGDSKLTGDTVRSELLASMLGNLSDNDTEAPIWGSSVRCIYKTDILKRYNITFPEDIRFAEDLVFNVRYINRIDSAFVLNEALYRYTFNADSLMNAHVRYNKNAFEERIKLVQYIENEIDKIADHEELKKRFYTSQRCYFIESVGNAARAVKCNGIKYALSEIREIVNHPIVSKSVEHFDASSAKKRLSYMLMKYRLSTILFAYFAIRLR